EIPGRKEGWGEDVCELFLREWKVCREIRKDAVFTVLQNHVVAPYVDSGVFDNMSDRVHMFSCVGAHNSVWHNDGDLYFLRDVSKLVGDIVGEIRVRQNGGKLAEEKRKLALKEKEKEERERQEREGLSRRSSSMWGKKSALNRLGGAGGLWQKGMQCVTAVAGIVGG
ncbi:hypothetical protein TL16_g13418, partial [Triparma laevis f. inornata]